MSRSRLLLVWAAVVLTAAFAMPATAAQERIGSCQPGLGIALSEFPRGTEDPRARTYIIDRVRPGAEFSRQFQVCNGTRESITVRLYPGPAVVEDGSFTIVEGRATSELSSWIRVEPSQVTIPSGELITARAFFTVPGDAQDGEQYAVLLAELPARPGATGIATASRVGIRVYLAVGEGDAPANDFRIDSLQASRGADRKPLVTAVVRNTGARALDLSGELRLSDGPGGLSAGPFQAQLGTTLGPGDSSPVRIPLDDAIRGGPWTATLTLRSGLLERSARAQITFPDAAGAEAAPVTAENLSPAEDPKILIPIAGSLILLIILALLWWLLARRRNKEREEQEPVLAG